MVAININDITNPERRSTEQIIETYCENIPDGMYEYGNTPHDNVTIKSSVSSIKHDPDYPIYDGARQSTQNILNKYGSNAVHQTNVKHTIITPVKPPVVHVNITTSNLSCVKGVAFSQTLTATGGTSPYTWSISSGTLPAGLTLNSKTGVISGTPSSSATGGTITVQAKDALNNVATKEISINVTSRLVIDTGNLLDGGVGALYNQSLSVDGGSNQCTWSIINNGATAGGLPDGLTLDAATGVISGTPKLTATAGTYNFTVQVKDSLNPSNVATKNLTINIPVPHITLSESASNVPEGASVTYTLTTANIADGTKIPYSILGLADGTLSSTFTVSGNTASVTVPVKIGQLSTGSANVSMQCASQQVSFSVYADSIQNLTQGQINALTTDQIQSFTPAQIALLSTTQLSYFSPAQIGALTPDQIAAMTNYQIQSLSTTQIAALSRQQLAAWSQTQYDSLSQTQKQAGTVIEIWNANDLSQVNYYLNGNYVQMADIDLSGINWNPIGNSSTPFTGTFDGDGHAIANLYIDQASAKNVGLFGYTSGAVISNVELKNADVTGGEDVGAIAGFECNFSTIFNSYVTTGNVTGGSFIGGLVGYNSNASISKSYFTGNVNGTFDVGGILGYGTWSSIGNSYFAGVVTGVNNTGALEGEDTGSSITDSHSTGAVHGGLDTGALVGMEGLHWYPSSIVNSYSSSAVTGGLYTGTLVGIGNPQSSILNSNFTGTVNASDVPPAS